MNKSVNVYDTYGCAVDCFDLPEEMVWVEGRISLGVSGTYYKGCGTRYSYHFSHDMPWRPDSQNMLFFPGGIKVVNPYLCNKYGIFLSPHSPAFSELIGGCGLRESALIENSRSFGRSDVTVLDKIDIPISGHSIYAVSYDNNRKHFSDYPKPGKLLELIDYMLDHDWNIPWNKGAISDVTPNGTITDVADLFRSGDVSHKVGTVFSLLSSLYRDNAIAYQEIKKVLGFQGGIIDLGLTKRLFNDLFDECIHLTAFVVAKRYPDIIGPLFTYKEIKEFILKFVVSGRNFGYGEKKIWGDAMKQAYVQRLTEPEEE